MISPRPLLFRSHLLLFVALFLWFNPGTHALCVACDKAIFYALNGSLQHHPAWQSFWGMLNHRSETTYNLVLACCFNLWAIWQTKDPKTRKQVIKGFIACWICFELVFCLQEYFFHDFLILARHSPSLVLEPSLRLSVQLQDPNIKDISRHCFPGGHAFALLYWALFSLMLSPKRIGIFGLIFALFLCLPRLFSGAHWMSDIVFSGLLAFACFAWTCVLFYRFFPLHRTLLPLREKVARSAG